MAPTGINKRSRRPGQSESSSSILPSNSKNKKNKNNNGKAATTIKREIKISNSSSDGAEVLLRRPKVYITDISCFKKLVQELTGNGSLATTNCTVANDPVNHAVPVSSQSESDSVETFSPVDSSSETASFGSDEMMLMNGLVCKTTSSSSDDCYDLVAWDDLEALMQDMDQDRDQDQFSLFELSNFQGSSQIHHQYYEEDLSIYDYDFSGILC